MEFPFESCNLLVFSIETATFGASQKGKMARNPCCTPCQRLTKQSHILPYSGCERFGPGTIPPPMLCLRVPELGMIVCRGPFGAHRFLGRKLCPLLRWCLIKPHGHWECVFLKGIHCSCKQGEEQPCSPPSVRVQQAGLSAWLMETSRTLYNGQHLGKNQEFGPNLLDLLGTKSCTT